MLKLVDFPEALQVLEFADGRASLIAVRAFAGGPLVSQPIKELRRHIPKVDTRIVALFRDDASVRVDGDTMIQPDDEVFFLAATRDVRVVMDAGEVRIKWRTEGQVVITGTAEVVYSGEWLQD